MPSTKALLAILVLIAHQLPMLAQAPNFTGTWKLNLEKSRLEDPGDGLTGSLFIIQQEGTKFHLTRFHYFGEKKNKISFAMVADGKTRRVKILFRGKLEQEDSGLLATLWRKNFTNIVHYRFGNSQDELIAEEDFTGRPGYHHHNIWVFDRAPAEVLQKAG